MCRPDVAVLTLIGLEHTQGLGDHDSIEREEGDIFDGLSPSGIAICNGDDQRVMRQIELRELKTRHVTFGCEKAVDYFVSHQLGQNLDRILVSIQRSKLVGAGTLTFESKLLGKPGAMAAAAALAVVESLGMAIDPSQVQSAFLRHNLGEAGRLNWSGSTKT